MLVFLLPVPLVVAAKEERWVRVVAPEFTVVTPLPEAEASVWAAEFAQYIAALRGLFRTEGRRLPPLTFVLFARARDFHAYRPLNEKGKAQELDGFFLRHESWSVAGMAGTAQSRELRRTIFHEGVHWYLSSMERQNPVWLEEGIAEVFSTFAVAKKQVEWGRPIEGHVALLNQEGPLPLERLLSTARSDLFGDDRVHTTRVYAESWAFVHFLLFGKHAMQGDALAVFLDALQKQTDRSAAFRSAFGRGYKEMDVLLRDYVTDGQYYIRRSALVPVSPPKVEPASAADVADALGRLAFAARRWDEAARQARAAVAAAPGDPRGHELLGLVLKEQGQAEESTAAFAEAIEKGTRDFQPFFEVAAAAQNAAFGMAGLGTMDPAEARRVANNYERAINLRPRFLPAYQNLAGVIGVAEPWSAADREFFELGLKLFPGDPSIRLGLAILTHRAGDVVAAHAQVAEVLAIEDLKTPTRNFARRLEDSWQSQVIVAELQELAAAKKLPQALALIDRKLREDLPVQFRAQLGAVREQLRLAVRTGEFDTALQNQRWTDARRIGAEILTTGAPPEAKAHVRRALGELDRKKLGMPESAGTSRN